MWTLKIEHHTSNNQIRKLKIEQNVQTKNRTSHFQQPDEEPDITLLTTARRGKQNKIKIF